MTPAVIIACPELGRDLRPILAAVPDAVVYRAARKPERHEGLRLALQGAARLARANKWPAVFIIEDDCAFTEHFDRARWEADGAWAFKHGYTLLNGGCFSAARPRRVRDGLVAVDRFKSSHCILVHHSAYDVLERLVYPVDVSMGKLGARPVVTVPFVAVQAPVISGHLDRFEDNLHMYARCESLLRAAA